MSTFIIILTDLIARYSLFLTDKHALVQREVNLKQRQIKYNLFW